LDEIEVHRLSGVPVVLASASLDVVVEAFAEQLGACGWIASRLGWDEGGRCKGVLSEDATGRKLALLRERFGALGGFRVLTDNPEDRELVAAALSARWVRDDED
jgi:phosphoserine phosphatase